MVTQVLKHENMRAPDLSAYRGKWVALKGATVIAAADTPNEVLRQLDDQGATGWVLDRVPENPNNIFVL